MNNCSSSVNYCGWLSEFFNVSSGTRQGCPFSALAFIVSIELISLKLKNDPNIKGLKFWKTNHTFTDLLKIAMYADDVTLFLNDHHEMKRALDIFDAFEKISGLQVNKQKSEAMWLGSRQNSTDSFYEFTWKKQIKILGIYFSNNKQASDIHENWSKRLSQVKSNVLRWQKKNLSIIGKICITKTFLISQFIYMQCKRL